MIKEWATVVSWQNGVALVHCECESLLQQLCFSRRLRKPGAE
ncbi:Sigma factor RpoE regulatory protein RseC [Klebsiella michiganensis]|uniref:Sigma factor RpoE regulatory protein RseC n=1 Tax=Klebsiella michiganensis TaxID=1134687 RepID=A0A7H4PN53_9ENTR|nr:Sigma factor RpoE regulatory protein RseC [Klebsiella michiganensis]